MEFKGLKNAKGDFASAKSPFGWSSTPNIRKEVRNEPTLQFISADFKIYKASYRNNRPDYQNNSRYL